MAHVGADLPGRGPARAGKEPRGASGLPPGLPRRLRPAFRVVLGMREPAFLVWGAERCCAGNDACLSALRGVTEPGALPFEAIRQAIAPQIEAAMTGDHAAGQEGGAIALDLPGRAEQSWWHFSCSPVPRGGVLVLCHDVTAEHQTREALREAETRARMLFDAAPFGVIVIDTATYEVLDVNDFACREYGYTREEFLRLRMQDIDALHCVPSMRRRGRAHTIRPGTQEFEAQHRTRSGEVRDVLVRVHGFSIGGRAMTFGAHIDITQRKAAEARQTLLMRELDHRARNALAVVQAALRLTPRSDAAAYSRAVEGRVKALARAHTLLAEGRWDGAELRAVLAAELKPFLTRQRVELDGPPVLLPPAAAQSLAMAVHELATNAVKHGALSVAAGRIAARWSREPGGPLRLAWSEAGGPTLTGRPARLGFGSRVLDATIRHQLGGEVALRWEEGGLVCEMTVPLGTRPPRDAHAAGGPGTGPGALEAATP